MNVQQPKTFLITSGRTPAGLDLARTLSRCGHRVLVAESIPVHLCQFSRFARSFRVPEPSRDPTGYVSGIRKIVERESVDLVIPVYEEIFPLAYYRDQIGCDLHATDFELLRRLHNKYEFIEICQKINCSCPETKLVTHADEIEDASDRVLKPQYSRFGTDVYFSPDRLTIQSLNFEQPWVMQQLVTGDPYCGFCLAKQGRVLLEGIYPVDVAMSGVCIAFRHQPVKSISQWMEDFVQNTGFSGFIGFDFFVDRDVVFPVECNPRITSGIHLYSNQQALVDAIVDGQPAMVFEPQPAMAGIFVMSRALFKWSLWKNWLSSKDVIFEWSDPLPVIGQLLELGYFNGMALKLGRTITEVSSVDIEYNGQDYRAF